MKKQSVGTTTSEYSERGVNGIKKRILRAIDHAEMGIAYGMEAADHYRRRYGLLDCVYDGFHGFIDGFKLSSVNKNG
ncbi:hypothetical protein IT804_003469 [Salmonella enterica]|nr:hypothetical protein [Salmonella enterica]EGO2951934.1 hypothetical protein [Salmonella enterica]